MQKVLLIFLICSALAFVESKPNEKNMDWWTKGNVIFPYFPFFTYPSTGRHLQE